MGRAAVDGVCRAADTSWGLDDVAAARQPTTSGPPGTLRRTSHDRPGPMTGPAPLPPHAAARSPRLYLDDAGAAPVLAEARRARGAVPDGSPASPHREGRAARAALDAARDRAAGALGRGAREVVFCASGTEAVNLALLGAGRRLARGRSVVT